MGMFDSIYCSCDIGTSFYFKELQTKDLDCSMRTFWISPIGQLFEIDYSGTYDFIEKEDNNGLWFNFDKVKNGNKGRVFPCAITELIEVYPAKWNCYYAPLPRIKILFIDGVIESLI